MTSKETMKKIPNIDDLRSMWRDAGRGKDYGLDGFKDGYCRYFGCGNHLYILVKGDYDEEKVIAIGKQRIHPRFMSEQLTDVVKDYRVIMVDVEMGGMSVYPQ